MFCCVALLSPYPLSGNKGLCNNYQEGGAEKLELSSKNVDSTPPPKQKKMSSNPPLLC